MAVDPKDPTQPDINVFVSQLCEELRALKTRINLLEGRSVHAPDGDVLTQLPAAALRALKTLTFNAVGDAEVIAPIAGDYSSYAAELANRLKRDGSQAMLGALTLSGNGVDPLHATTLQQMQIADDNVRFYVERLGRVRVAVMQPFTNAEEHFGSMSVLDRDGNLIIWSARNTQYLTTGIIEDVPQAPAVARFNTKSTSYIAGWTSNGNFMLVWFGDGTVHSAGLNARGFLGHGDTTARNIFTRLEYFVTTQPEIIVDAKTQTYYNDNSYSNALFRTQTGKMYFVGYTDGGIAGDGSTALRNLSTPVRCGTLTDIVDFCAGGDAPGHVFAWKADGSLYAWGYGSIYVSLGLGTNVSVATPTIVPGMSVRKVATMQGRVQSSEAHYMHALALMQDKTVRSTGINEKGQLGNNSTAFSNTFVSVVGLTDIKDVGVFGGVHGTSWAVSETNELWTWGANNVGQCGIGTTVDALVPVKPVGYIDSDLGGAVVTTGDAPFQGKVFKIAHTKTYQGPGKTRGTSTLLVLDTDGEIWFAGYDTFLLYGHDDTQTFTRFTKARRPALRPGEKILDMTVNGHSEPGYQGLRLFVRTNQDRILSAGRNFRSLCTASANTTEGNWRVGLSPVPGLN